MFIIFHIDVRGRTFYRALVELDSSSVVPWKYVWQPFESKAEKYTYAEVSEIMQTFAQKLAMSESLSIKRVGIVLDI
jgi:hypothetical protein